MCCSQVGLLPRSHTCSSASWDLRLLLLLLLALLVLLLVPPASSVGSADVSAEFAAAGSFCKKVWNCRQLFTPVGTTYATPAHKQHSRQEIETEQCDLETMLCTREQFLRRASHTTQHTPCTHCIPEPLCVLVTLHHRCWTILTCMPQPLPTCSTWEARDVIKGA